MNETTEKVGEEQSEESRQQPPADRANENSRWMDKVAQGAFKAKTLIVQMAGKAWRMAEPALKKAEEWVKKQPLAVKAVAEMQKRPKIFNRRNAIVAVCVVVFLRLAGGGGGDAGGSGGGDKPLSPSVPLHPSFASQFQAKPGSEPAKVALKCRNALCDSDNWLTIEDLLTKGARDSLRKKLHLISEFDSDHSFVENWTVVKGDTAVVSMVPEGSNGGRNESVFALNRIKSKWLISGMDYWVGDGFPEMLAKRRKQVFEAMGKISAEDLKKACLSSDKPPAYGSDKDSDEMMLCLLAGLKAREINDMNLGLLVEELATSREKLKKETYYYSLKMLNTWMWYFFLYDCYYSGDYFWDFKYKENGWESVHFGLGDAGMAASVKCLATLRNGSTKDFEETVKKEQAKDFEPLFPYKEQGKDFEPFLSYLN